MRLSIENWSVRDTADADGQYVRIHGREAGLVGMALRRIGIEATTSLSIDDKRIRLARRSLTGSALRVTPLSSMASVACGRCKPWKGALVLATGGSLALVLPGAGWLAGTFLLLLAPVTYFFTDRLFLELVDHGGRAVRIEFERSVLPEARIDESASARIVSIVEMLRLHLATPRPLVDDRVLFDTFVESAGTRSLEPETSTVIVRRLMDIIKAKKAPQDAPVANGASRAAAKDTTLLFTDDGASEEAPIGDDRGSQMRLNCLTCGNPVQFNDVFCINCGVKLPFLPG